MSGGDVDETVYAATARVYVNTGWKVFPVWWPASGGCACPAGADCASPAKHPLTRRGVHGASDDLAIVAAWWSHWPEANIGLPAGGNGLAVLDVDPRHGGLASLALLVGDLAANGQDWPATLRATTGAGGVHFFFQAPPGGAKAVANAFGPDMSGLDTRGRGSYVVAAPSRHVSGGIYEWVNFFDEPAGWPDRLTLLMGTPLATSTQLSVTTGDIPQSYAGAALSSEVSRVQAAQEGARNDTLHVAAFRLGQLVAVGALDAATVADQLVQAGLSTGLSLGETRATVRSGLRAGSVRPRIGGGS